MQSRKLSLERLWRSLAGKSDLLAIFSPWHPTSGILQAYDMVELSILERRCKLFLAGKHLNARLYSKHSRLAWFKCHRGDLQHLFIARCPAEQH